jgi:hypothetical protein
VTTVTKVTGTPSAWDGNDGLGVSVTAIATCASGKVVGGGGDVNNNGPRHYGAITSSYPSSATTWTVIATYVAGTYVPGSPASLTAYALCAS